MTGKQQGDKAKPAIHSTREDLIAGIIAASPGMQADNLQRGEEQACREAQRDHAFIAGRFGEEALSDERLEKITQLIDRQLQQALEGKVPSLMVEGVITAQAATAFVDHADAAKSAISRLREVKGDVIQAAGNPALMQDATLLFLKDSQSFVFSLFKDLEGIQCHIHPYITQQAGYTQPDWQYGEWAQATRKTLHGDTDFTLEAIGNLSGMGMQGTLKDRVYPELDNRGLLPKEPEQRPDWRRFLFRKNEGKTRRLER